MTVTRDQVSVIVRKHLLSVLDVLPDADFSGDRSLAALGANSLDTVEVISGAARELKISLPRSEWTHATTVDALIDCFHRAAAARSRDTPR